MKEEKNNNNYYHEFKQIKINILENNNPNDLILLEKEIINYGIPYFELLPYSKHLMNDDNNTFAFSVYASSLICLHASKYDINFRYFPEAQYLSYFNENEINEVLFYLEKGSELKSNRCSLFLVEIYKNGFGVEIDLEKAEYFKSKLEY